MQPLTRNTSTPNKDESSARNGCEASVNGRALRLQQSRQGPAASGRQLRSQAKKEIGLKRYFDILCDARRYITPRISLSELADADVPEVKENVASTSEAQEDDESDYGSDGIDWNNPRSIQALEDAEKLALAKLRQSYVLF
ncbi:hypothetical protein BT96DRAFT_1010938 [Gymnopus androsaceus JB14]|uniref:Uncharacterized protein n=1 Tax=Gymnopus androsaceus JB14 TaxID=1447944 RepID=A0A6A4GA12_9AGAR|nr:hypothetical protein BT96DRAFT_1010938 [Gymnopus androsaceus JB14]